MSDNQWSDAVTHRPPATFPPAGLYTQNEKTIYLEMRKPDVSPNGLASAIQMVQFFINRAGKKLSSERKSGLKQAIVYLQVELKFRNLDARVNAIKGPVPPKLWDEFLEAQELWGRLNEEIEQLSIYPAPVHPAPSKEKMIGGRNGFNGPYKP